MKTIIIDREDICNPIHPLLFDQMCEDLGLDPKTTDQITLTVAKAEAS